jgi:hypothetical protein
MSLACFICAGAQTTPAPTPTPADAPPPATASAPPAPQTSADEDFELNIGERRINEESFEASTEVEVGGRGERGVNLRVGVAVGAGSIEVLLRNVRGRVRFRGSLDELLRRINVRRPESTAPP